MSRTVPVVTAGESLFYNLAHMLPYFLRGIFKRNHFWYRLWSRFHPDPLGVRFITALRQKYQSDYLYLNLLSTKSLLILDHAGIRHVLDHSPTIYADAKLKHEGMSHFQPHALTISRGEEWADRRQFNEAVLNTGHSLHAYAGPFLEVIRREVATLDFTKPVLQWADFAALFERIALQLLFGHGEGNGAEGHSGKSAAAVSAALSNMMAESNRAVGLRPSRYADGFVQGIRHFLAHAGKNSLAYLSSMTPSTAQTKVENQLPHWLFAMRDTLAENVVPTLALITSQPEAEARVRQEMAVADLATPQGIDALPYLEACIQEAMRLWPTTHMLARVSLVEDQLEGIAVPPNTQVVILNSFTHRDTRTHARVNDFSPEFWLGRRSGGQAEGQSEDAPPTYSFNHFSNGPQSCAGKELALFVAKAVLATMLRSGNYRLTRPTLLPTRPMPQTFNPFTARFQAQPRLES